MAFTAHNVDLPDGTSTFPSAPLLADTRLARSVMRTARNLCPPERADGTPATVVDLGCLEGGWTHLFATKGYDALGIEARAANVENCEYLRERSGLDNLRFVQDDARNVAEHGTFDITFCMGLLYHLDNPVRALQEIAKATSRLLILDTHFAPGELSGSNFAGALSDWAVNEGRPGRWYREWMPYNDRAIIEGMKWASYDNSESFWLEPMNLLDVLREVGFNSIYEQWDQYDDITVNPTGSNESRGMFIAVKS